jgi:hypothetical protein
MHSDRKYRKAPIGFFIITVMFMSLTTGCGYHTAPDGDSIDKGIQTVFVDNFGNRTSEANVENMMRSAFIDRFIKGRRLRLVDSKEAADAICKGMINGLTSAPLSYNKDNFATEERISVTMEITLEERTSGKVLWMAKGFPATQDYQFTDINTKRANRKFALSKLSNDAAERAYRLIMSGF